MSSPPATFPAPRRRLDAARAKRPSALRSGIALLLANLRYWSGVAPAVRDQLARWRRTAASAPEPALRAAALMKLREERFNVEVAATLATLAPSRRRTVATTAIVALQIAYDHLDLLTESPSLRQGEAQQMLCRLLDAVDLDGRAAPATRCYLDLLLETTASCLRCLPAAAQVSPAARGALARCAEGQALAHGAIDPAGEAALSHWALRQARESRLGWGALAAGASASVLCAHALIAAAASPATTSGDARRLDSAYISIGALTMLDDLVDRAQDAEMAQHTHLSRYRDAPAMARELSTVAADALADLDAVPDGAHHAMTLAGVVAYYASLPAASEPPASAVFAALRADLGWLLPAPLAVMRLWRLAKRLRRATPAMTNGAEIVSSTHLTDAHRSRPLGVRSREGARP